MKNVEPEKKKKTVKKTTVKKQAINKTTKKVTKATYDPNVNLWVTDDNGYLTRVSMKFEYKIQYVKKFGTESITTKHDFEAWYSSIYLQD